MRNLWQSWQLNLYFLSPRVRMIAPDYFSFQLNISSDRAYVEKLVFSLLNAVHIHNQGLMIILLIRINVIFQNHNQASFLNNFLCFMVVSPFHLYSCSQHFADYNSDIWSLIHLFIEMTSTMLSVLRRPPDHQPPPQNIFCKVFYHVCHMSGRMFQIAQGFSHRTRCLCLTKLI